MDSIALLVKQVNYRFIPFSFICYNTDMDDLKKKYQAQIEQMDSENLKIILEDREKALECARKGIEQVEPENLTPEHTEAVANEMQIIAKIILEERKIN